MLTQLFAALRTYGAADCGAVALRHIPLSPDKLCAVYDRLPTAKTVVCAIYSYNAPDIPGANLCRYARGLDYHTVLRTRLEAAARDVPGLTAAALIDASPLPEVQCAAMAGLGVVGDNGLLQHPVYGSRIFIGTLLTDLDFDAPSREISSCIRCGACVRSCPTGALQYKTGAVTYDISRCLSELTQKRGDVTEHEAAALKTAPYIWGCDCCTDVCPVNLSAPLSELPEFTEHLLPRLENTDLDGLSDRAFRKTYADRAFSWRGIGPLKRNLQLKNDK